MTVPEPIYYEPPTSDVNLNVNQAKPQLLKSQYKQPLNNELNLLISTLDQELSTGKVGATNTNIAYNTITPNAIASFAATSSRMTSTIHSNHGFPLPQQQQQRLPQLLPALNSICSHATNFYPPTFLPIRPPADLSSTEDSWTRRDQSAATPAPMLIDKHHLFHRQPRSLPQTPVEMGSLKVEDGISPPLAATQPTVSSHSIPTGLAAANDSESGKNQIPSGYISPRSLPASRSASVMSTSPSTVADLQSILPDYYPKESLEVVLKEQQFNQHHNFNPLLFPSKPQPMLLVQRRHTPPATADNSSDIDTAAASPVPIDILMSNLCQAANESYADDGNELMIMTTTATKMAKSAANKKKRSGRSAAKNYAKKQKDLIINDASDDGCPAAAAAANGKMDFNIDDGSGSSGESSHDKRTYYDHVDGCDQLENDNVVDNDDNDNDDDDDNDNDNDNDDNDYDQDVDDFEDEDAADSSFDPDRPRQNSRGAVASTRRPATTSISRRQNRFTRVPTKIGGISTDNTVLIDQNGEFRCHWPGCTKNFSRIYNLKSHMKTHTGEKPFKCPHCDLSFGRNHDLKRHVRVHSGNRPYVCEGCSKSFTRLDALNRHALNSCRGKSSSVDGSVVGMIYDVSFTGSRGGDDDSGMRSLATTACNSETSTRTSTPAPVAELLSENIPPNSQQQIC